MKTVSKILVSLVMLFSVQSAFGQSEFFCRQQANDAFQRAYNDCMRGGGGVSCRYDSDCYFGQVCEFGRCVVRNPQQECASYTQHGEYACREHSGCNWSYFSSQCYPTTGMPCENYTIHGEYACRDNSQCNWSYVSSSCYRR